MLGRPVLGSLRRWTGKEQLTGLKQGQARWKQSMQALFPIKTCCRYMTGVCSIGTACIKQVGMSSIQALQNLVHDSTVALHDT